MHRKASGRNLPESSESSPTGQGAGRSQTPFDGKPQPTPSLTTPLPQATKWGAPDPARAQPGSVTHKKPGAKPGAGAQIWSHTSTTMTVTALRVPSATAASAPVLLPSPNPDIER